MQGRCGAWRFPNAALALLSLGACATAPQAAPPAEPPTITAPETPGEPATISPPPSAGEAPASSGSETQPLPPRVQAALDMNAQEERNAALVTAFYELVFQDHRVAEAFDRYGGEGYIQHSPGSPDGRAAVEASLVPYFAQNPQARSEIKRVIAQGDLVVLHVHAKSDPVDRGRAVVEIFRVEDGRIVEHWDVIQPVPVSAANDNTMF